MSINSPRRGLPIRGPSLLVRFARYPDGSNIAAAREWEDLPDEDQAAALAWLEELAERGRLLNASRFKKVRGHDVWELRVKDYRLLLYWKRDTIVICNIVAKRREQLKTDVFRRAQRIGEGDLG